MTKKLAKLADALNALDRERRPKDCHPNSWSRCRIDAAISRVCHHFGITVYGLDRLEQIRIHLAKAGFPGRHCIADLQTARRREFRKERAA